MVRAGMQVVARSCVTSSVATVGLLPSPLGAASRTQLSPFCEAADGILAGKSIFFTKSMCVTHTYITTHSLDRRLRGLCEGAIHEGTRSMEQLPPSR